jgi:sugar phosphate isomerase/epimerase
MMSNLAVSTQLFGMQEIGESHLALIRESGFRVVEVFAAPGHFEWEDAACVARVAKALGSLDLSVCSLHAPWAPGQDIASLDAVRRETSLRSVERAVDALVTLGGKALVLHPGATPGPPEWLAKQLDYARAGIERVAGYCTAHGVRVALENPPPYELAGDNQQMLALYRDFAAEPSVQACFDTGHANVSADGIAFVRQVPKELLLVHLSDNTGTADDHLPPEDGTINWQEFFAMLRAREFSGYLVLELTDLPDPARILADGWVFMNHIAGDMA